MFTVRKLANAVVDSCKIHIGFRDEINEWVPKANHYQCTKYLTKEMADAAGIPKGEPIPSSSLFKIAQVISENVDSTNVYFFRKNKVLAQFETGAKHDMKIYHDLTIIVGGQRRVKPDKADPPVDKKEVQRCLSEFKTKNKKSTSWIIHTIRCG